ncbi:hypothetical protein [Cardinium endosymbiont of Culicoides punctatus]|uniref:hypothetical protein n=1 Tax=Cardinium endosymbiont of Culicoides punctatus TaxID=2304601 RepID=UPI001058FCEA|nr:hypothetical protein [Cardinium endosymbiont of Culicoides punctatus]TDG95652.1 hypothetical protein CCPUN_01080 [Cardinium endosymbiont of Culicoides punctatus]
MKIKITLLSWLVANGITHAAYADDKLNQDESASETFIINEGEQQPADTHKELKEKEEGEEEEADKGEPTRFKVSGSIKMDPSIAIQDSEITSKNQVAATLTCKADVPKVLCDKDAAINISASFKKEKVTLTGATVTLAKMLTVGYTSSILANKEANTASLISAKIFQIKMEHAFDWFRLGYAVESPVVLQTGKFDKNAPLIDKNKPAKKDQPKPITLDKKEDVTSPLNFKLKGTSPTFGLSLGLVTDRVDIGLSGLGRFTDYTHKDVNDTQPKEKKEYLLTWGGNLGIQYKIVPKQFTIKGQATYVRGLGDYLAGFKAIQGNVRKEMCAVYYTEPSKSDLFCINAYGFGGDVEWCITPKFTFSVSGDYITTVKDADKPGIAFGSSWSVNPEMKYKLSKRWTVSTKYTLSKENKVDSKLSEGVENKIGGGISFSF